MPVSFNSPPRNLFLLGSGAQDARLRGCEPAGVIRGRRRHRGAEDPRGLRGAQRHDRVKVVRM